MMLCRKKIQVERDQKREVTQRKGTGIDPHTNGTELPRKQKKVSRTENVECVTDALCFFEKISSKPKAIAQEIWVNPEGAKKVSRILSSR